MNASPSESSNTVSCLVVEMPDESRWAVSVETIARNRALEYADEFEGDIERSLQEDTWPVFKDLFEIKDWAEGNMNWSDVESVAVCLQAGLMQEGAPVRATPKDFQEGWMNGNKTVKPIEWAVLKQSAAALGKSL